jgi:hypothetical protein
MSAANLTKLLLAIVLLAGASFGFYRFYRNDTGISEQTYFYDLSEQKLFAASREALPPIRGLNGPEEDAVRAVVICASGSPDDPANRSIAYLEKYAPELKASLEQVRAGKAEPLPSKVRNGYRFVKRTADDKWHAANSPEGEKILNGWNVAGADGKYPIVCSP